MIPRRICKTKADWQQGAIDAKDALDKGKMRLNPIALGNPNGGG
jgi:hypothetical protein